MYQVTKAFKGVPDGATQCRDFAPGDTVEGALGEVAFNNKWAKKAKGRAAAEDNDQASLIDEPEAAPAPKIAAGSGSAAGGAN